MIVVVDERELVKDGYTSLFGREGIPSTGFDPGEFGEWVQTAADSDLAAVEAFLIGQGQRAMELPRAIRDRSMAPVIAVSDQPSLENTLALLTAAWTTLYASRCIRVRFSRAPLQSVVA